MHQARMALEIDGLDLLPRRLLAENLSSHLVDLGLTCVDHGFSDDIVPTNLSLTPGTLDDVVVIGRLVGINKFFAPALDATE